MSAENREQPEPTKLPAPHLDLELITAGNPNLETLRTVLQVSRLRFPRIRRVVFLDVELELSLDERRRIVDQVLGSDVEFVLARVPLERLSERIPAILAERVQATGNRERLVVDLTNGTKEISSVLYAAASLLRLANIVVVNVPASERSRVAREPTTSDVASYLRILHPLQEAETVGRAGLFRIYYYLEAFERFAREIVSRESRRGERASPYLIGALENDLRTAVESYFRGDHQATVARLGVVAEALTRDLARAAHRACRGQGTFQSRPPDDPAGAYEWLRVQLCERLAGALGRAGDEVERLPEVFQRLRHLVTADALLLQLRRLRNISSHPNDPGLHGEGEASMAIHAMLYLLDTIVRSDAFNS